MITSVQKTWKVTNEIEEITQAKNCQIRVTKDIKNTKVKTTEKPIQITITTALACLPNNDAISDTMRSSNSSW